MKSIIFLLLLASISAKAQQDFKITGHVTDQAADKLPFTSIVITNSSQSKAVLSDENGFYTTSLSSGKYAVKVSAVGYKAFQDSITVNSSLTFNIVLQKDVKTLSEVKVVADKPIVEQKIDRLVFNVGNSIFNRGFSALEVLNQTPRVEVSPEGQLTLIGKSTLAVMIDGRIIQGDVLKERLSAIRSDNIASIEVITTPPAKYSAQGNSGLINIVTKKSANLGWLVNMTSVYRQRTFSGGSQTANINYKTERLDLNVNVDGFIEKKRYQNKMNYELQTINWENATVRDAFAKGFSVNSSLNYKLNRKMNIGFLADVTLQQAHETGQTNSSFMTVGRSAADSSIYAPADYRNRYDLKSVTGYYDYIIDSSGKKLTINANYFEKVTNTSRIIENIISSYRPRQETFANSGDTRYQGSSVNADLELPYKFAKIETGGALAYINNHALLNSTGIFIPADENDFTYKESTAALYLSGTKKLSEKWSAKVGVRYENTQINGELKNSGGGNAATFSNLLPSVFLSYKPNAKNSVTLAYSKRIEKPQFFSLNPYRTYTNSYSYSTGNPYLLPSFSNNLELTHTYKNNLTTSLSATLLNDAIGSITTFGEDEAITVSKQMNYYKSYVGNLYMAYTLPLTWVNSYNTFSLSYSRAVTYKQVISLPDVNGFNAYYAMRNTFTLNSSKTTFLVVNYRHSFPGASNFYRLKTSASLDVGVRFQSRNRAFQYNLLLSDLFKSSANRTAVRYNNAIQNTYNYNDLRYLNASVSYSFGNKKARASTKYIDGGNKNRAIL